MRLDLLATTRGVFRKGGQVTRPASKRIPGGRLHPDRISEVNQQFHAETLQFRFRYRCGDCEHFNREDETCSMRYPRVEVDSPKHQCRSEEGALLFCKYFELDGSIGGGEQ